MSEHVLLLIIPGLRAEDVTHMPALASLAADVAPLAASFPSVSAVVQTSMTTGLLPQDHGVVCDGTFDRQTGAWKQRHLAISSSAERIWTTIRGYDQEFRCGLIGLQPVLGEDGGPLPAWIAERPGDEADPIAPVLNAVHERSQLILVRLPHLDGPGHLHGPKSAEFAEARKRLNDDIGRLIKDVPYELAAEAGQTPPLWIVASEYVISPVTETVSPNRILRQSGWLQVASTADDGETLRFDPQRSAAWAMCDYEMAHVYLRGAAGDPSLEDVACVFRNVAGIAEVLTGEGKHRRDLDHPLCGDLVLIADPSASFRGEFSSQVAWRDTPDVAWWDAMTCGWLSAEKQSYVENMFAGSHGAPADSPQRRGVVLASEPGVLLGSAAMADFDVAGLLLRQFGI